MGGWFTHRSPQRKVSGIALPDAGLELRCSGKLGAIVVTLPGGEIMPATQDRQGARDHRAAYPASRC